MSREETVQPNTALTDVVWQTGAPGPLAIFAGYHTPTIVLADIGAAAVLAADTLTLFAMPTLRGGRLSRVRWQNGVVAIGTGLLRVGLYRSTSARNLYPLTLVADFGETDITAGGVFSLLPAVGVTVGAVYWLAALCNADAAGTTFQGIGRERQWMMGWDEAWGNLRGSILTVARAYGALPAACPAGAAFASVSPADPDFPVFALSFDV